MYEVMYPGIRRSKCGGGLNLLVSRAKGWRLPDQGAVTEDPVFF
jgi:hypothetical protein